jgi:putative FmdB family regulatory protein
MPKYDYLCADCETQFEARHSYKFKGVICPHCQSAKVSKILSTVSKVVKYKTTKEGTTKVGTEVNQAIAEGQQELKKTKKDLKGKVYKK